MAHTVGIIGLGFGRAHIPAFRASGCEVIALCRRDQAAARNVADAYAIPQVFDRWETMLERARPDIVVIATPPRLHAEIACRAFDAGAHVLCEKPLAMTRAEALTMVQAAARARRVAMTSFNWRFPAAMREMRRRAPALGRVLHLAGRWLGGRWGDEKTAPTWRMDRAEAGHGAMGDQGVHLIDLVRWNFGEFKRVSAQAGIGYPSRTVQGGGRPADAEDYCLISAELASGAAVTLEVSRVAHGTNDQTLEVFGSGGALSYRLLREGPRWYEGELRAAAPGGAWQAVKAEAPAVTADGADPMDIIGATTIAPLVAHMLDCIRTGAAPSPSFEDGLRAQAVLDAVLESASRRTWMDVPG
jgi:predicted dehydrogenase